MDGTEDSPKLESGRQEPPRHLRLSTRGNAAFKWKEDKKVVGALEMVSFAAVLLDPRAKMEEHRIPTVADEFDECLKIWQDHKLQKSFAEAVEGIPPEMKCCGLISDPDGSIFKLAPLLNKGWAKKVSEEYFNAKGYRVSCFGTKESQHLLV
jgi:hypothetical protein